MLLDANTLPREEILETDVCIIGAGPAGITLTKEFIGQDFRVTLLESGGLEPDKETQSLCDGITGDNSQFVPYHLRNRQFGGTANLWGIEIGNNQLGVRYAPFDEIDFEKRDWLPYSGWPFNKTDLETFYQRAHKVCQLGAFNYDATTWKEPQSPQLTFPGEQVITTMFQFGSREIFRDKYKEEINHAANITTYVNANVVDIETNQTAQVASRVKVITLKGNKFWVKAKIFILATGGIENARLLLLSNQSQKTGLGNQNDLVGRFFMDHYQVYCGMLIPANPQIFNQVALYDIHRVDDIPVVGKLSLNPELMHRKQLLNTATYLIPRHKTYYLRERAINSYQVLLASLRRGQMPQQNSKHIKNLIAGLKHVANAVHRRLIVRKPFFYAHIATSSWSEVSNKEREFAMFEIQHLIEQAPDPNNRVILSQEQDQLGCRKVQVDCFLRDIDLSSVRRTQEIFKEEFARSGLGELQIESEDLPNILSPSGGSHHMGTTRMHADPKQGVVDPNCKVHGISNLFIAGSSVFPTGSYTTPTLTIIALSIRLADHIKTLMLETKKTTLPYNTFK